MVKTRTERKQFKYKPRSKEDMKKRSTQSGGLYDSIVLSQFQTLRLKEDDYSLRIMPPTWDDPDHYGLDVWVHFGVGADEGSYICSQKMKGEKCPVCEERKRAEKKGDSDYAKSLTPSKRVAVWVINRDDEDSGPLVWVMPWTVDRDIAGLSIDKRSGEVICIDDPDEGFDIEFTKTGKGLKTKYIQMTVARRSTPLSDDEDTQEEWLEFITDNPIPDVLQYYDYEYVESIASAKPKPKDEDDDEEEKPRNRRRRSNDDDDDEPPRRKKKPLDEDDDDEVPFDTKRRKKALDDDDEDEEEKPRRKSAGREKLEVERPQRSRKAADDDDDEDDEPPRRRKARDDDDDEPPRKKKKRAVEEDEEEDESHRRKKRRQEEDDEEEEERPRKSSFRDRVRSSVR